MEGIFIPSEWDEKSYCDFQNGLKELAEEKYRSFNIRLIPDTPMLYGIRVPRLRKIAKEILKGDYLSYLSLPKSQYHEEVIIEGLVMAGICCDYPQTLAYMREFSAKIYNWAINDTVVFKNIKKYTDRFIDDVDEFIHSENPWVQRYGFLHLMNFFLNEKYIDKVLEKVDSVNSEFYYVQMMQAWLLATAAAKVRDKTAAYLENCNLNEATFKMTVKKARESFRISKEDKEYFKSLLQ